MPYVDHLFRNAIGALQRFRRDQRGTMALMMGVAAIPIIFSVGAGIDYSTANMAKAKLDAVADTAALSAVDHQAISGRPPPPRPRRKALSPPKRSISKMSPSPMFPPL